MANTLLSTDQYASSMALLLKNQLAYGVMLADPKMAVRITVKRPPRFELRKPRFELRKPRTNFDRYRTSTREGTIFVLTLALGVLALWLSL